MSDKIYDRMMVVDKFNSYLEVFKEEQTALAKSRKIVFDAHVEAGFTEAYSMAILNMFYGGSK